MADREFIRGYRDIARGRVQSTIFRIDTQDVTKHRAPISSYQRGVYAALSIQKLRQIADREVHGSVDEIKHALDTGYLSGCLPTSKRLGYETHRATDALIEIDNPWSRPRGFRAGSSSEDISTRDEISRHVRYLFKNPRHGE